MNEGSAASEVREYFGLIDTSWGGSRSGEGAFMLSPLLMNSRGYLRTALVLGMRAQTKRECCWVKEG